MSVTFKPRACVAYTGHYASVRVRTAAARINKPDLT